ncbi:hypothetical protein A2U01_0002265 [Trifolium medium]|uniref:Uncharacterized protein n=1 Tax=Trifolium medium TaxID=97028 RepID=A0A392M3Z0_9FABA|nr:hypothetical protein [Trifolium medium]
MGLHRLNRHLRDQRDCKVHQGPSTAHLEMKYYTNKGKVTTLHGDIEAARRCFEAATKGQIYIDKAPNSSKKPTPTPQPPAPNVSSVDLDNRFSKKENKEEKKLRKENKESDEASKEIPRPILDGEFELVLLGEDPSKGMKIGTWLPDLARKQLKACLRENADLFAWIRPRGCMPPVDHRSFC